MRSTTILIAAVTAALAVPALAGTATGRGAIPARTGFEQIREGRLDSAERIILAQMGTHPDAPELGLNLAAVYMRTGRAEMAAPIYRRVLAEPAVAMDMPSGSVVSSHDVARRASSMIRTTGGLR